VEGFAHHTTLKVVDPVPELTNEPLTIVYSEGVMVAEPAGLKVICTSGTVTLIIPP
jgi:hypothetical protein